MAGKAKAGYTAAVGTAKLLCRVLPLKRIALVAAGVGLAAGLVAVVCPPLLAGLLTAGGGAVLSAAGQVVPTLRRAGVLTPAIR